MHRRAIYIQKVHKLLYTPHIQILITIPARKDWSEL